MSDAGEPKTRSGGSWKTYAVLVVVVVVLLWAIDCMRAATEAETNLHSALVAVDMVDAYVESACGWPASWTDLEPMRLKQVREGNRWARDIQNVMRRVDIDFDPEHGLPRNDTMLTNPPIRPHFPYYPAPFRTRMDILIQTVKKCHDVLDANG